MLVLERNLEDVSVELEDVSVELSEAFGVLGNQEDSAQCRGAPPPRLSLRDSLRSPCARVDDSREPLDSG